MDTGQVFTAAELAHETANHVRKVYHPGKPRKPKTYTFPHPVETVASPATLTLSDQPGGTP